MNKKNKLPYLKFVRKIGKVMVWVVDGFFVRNTIDIEFLNFGQHYKYPYIPKNEFWLDMEATPDEQELFINHLLIEHKLMEKGVNYPDALDTANEEELKERLKLENVRKLVNKTEKEKLKAVKQNLWKKLANGLDVWIVDGCLVRSLFFIDFTEGGHDLVYKFIPEKEVWIDNDLVEEERFFVLLHELDERGKMDKGWPYDKAHYKSASNVELLCRKNPEKLKEELLKQGIRI